MRFMYIILISLAVFIAGCKIDADSGDADGKGGTNVNVHNYCSPEQIAYANEGARVIGGFGRKASVDSRQPGDKFGKKRAELSTADAKSGSILRETAQLEDRLRMLKEKRNQFSFAIERMRKLYTKYCESPSASNIPELGKDVGEFLSDRELLLAETGNLDGQISAIESRLPTLRNVQRIIALQSARAKASLDREAVEYKMQQLLVEAGEAIVACEKVCNSDPVPLGKDQTQMLAIAKRTARVEEFRAQLAGGTD